MLRELKVVSANRAQQIEVYADISGMAFTPEGSSLMISLLCEEYGGFLQYQKPFTVRPPSQ
jgi:hypothetical protein